MKIMEGLLKALMIAAGFCSTIAIYSLGFWVFSQVFPEDDWHKDWLKVAIFFGMANICYHLGMWILDKSSPDKKKETPRDTKEYQHGENDF